MPINVASLTKAEIENLIENHRRQGATDADLYVEALDELEKRKGNRLEFGKSLPIILDAAKARRFLSYKELADASGADWNQVHYAIGDHLWKLVEYAHRRKWPLLSAIVVNKSNVETGKMEPETLKGFIAAARELNIAVTDGEQFLAEQQKQVFEWAKTITSGDAAESCST
jgi:hypothetical protein